MNAYWLEILGYLASLIVLISLLMSSIIKLRWINLLGSAIFSLYGFLLGTYPVGFMNLCISIIDIYYLVKIYSTKEQFTIFPIDTIAPIGTEVPIGTDVPIEYSSKYFQLFMDFYQKDIEKYAGTNTFDSKDPSVCICILRNLVPAGIFIASEEDNKTLKVELDFVIPEYRDFKIGSFIYENNKNYFLEKGYSRLISYSSNATHIKYLKKMNFKEASEKGSTYFVKQLND